MNEAMAGMAYTVAGAAVCAVAQLSGKMAANYMPPMKMCAWRYGLAVPIGYLATVAMNGRLAPEISMYHAGMSSIISVISWGVGAVLFFSAMNMDSMHRVAPVSNSLSIWAAILSIVFLGEPFFPALGVVLAVLVAGIFLMAPAAVSEKRWKWAIPAAVGVSVLWAASIVMTKVIIHDIDYADFVFVKMAAAALYHLAFYPFVKGEVDRRGLAPLLISSATLVAGDILLMAGVDRLPASIFSPVFTTVIPFGFVGSIIFAGERPLKRNWLGMILIFIAAAACGYFGSK